MAKVVCYRDRNTGEPENLDSMLRRFKKQVLNDNILGECKKREYYLSKSKKRKLKSIEALKREKRRLSKNRRHK